MLLPLPSQNPAYATGLVNSVQDIFARSTIIAKNNISMNTCSIACHYVVEQLRYNYFWFNISFSCYVGVFSFDCQQYCKLPHVCREASVHQDWFLQRKNRGSKRHQTKTRCVRQISVGGTGGSKNVVYNLREKFV